MHDFAVNLHRLMARQGLTAVSLAARSGVHERTIKAILADRRRPHAKTIHQLAAGLGVDADELYRTQSTVVGELDRQTNPEVDEVVRGRPDLFADWDTRDLADLYSRFGEGGPLTPEGVLTVAAEINQRRDLLHKAALVLETADRDLLISIVEAMYARNAVEDVATPRRSS